MNVGDQTAAEARPQPRFYSFQIGRRLVGGNDNLPAFFDQGVEGVEKFFLSRVFAAHELYVVHHQHVNRTELFLESGGVLVAQGADEFVHEFFRRQVDNVLFRAALLDMPGDGMHQMGFAQTDAGIQKQRVKGNVVGFRHFARRGISKFVGFADHEIVKGVLRVERHRQRLSGFSERGVFGRLGGGLSGSRLVNGLRRRTGGNFFQQRTAGRIVHADGRIFGCLNDEVDAFDSRIFLFPDFVNAVGIIGDDPVAHKTGGNADIHDSVGKGTDAQGFEPAVESLFPHFRSELAANLSPLVPNRIFIIHYCFSGHFSEILLVVFSLKLKRS